MVWGLLGALGKAGGLLGIGGSLLQLTSARNAASRQMSFQEQMSSTAYQRSMADMRAAGLNPILAYKMGGATTPGGSSYTPPNIGQAAMQGVQTGASTAVALKRNVAELKNIQQDTDKKLEETYATAAEGARKIRETQLLETQNRIAAQNLITAEAQASSAKATKEFYDSKFGKFMKKFGLFGQEANPFANTQRSLRR